MQSRHDVIVLGGGPAGSVAAAALARRAHDVVLVTRRRAGHRALAESLPPSILKLLRATDLLDAVRAARFFPNGGNTAWWAGEPERSERFAGAPGFQVDAQRLEQVAVDTARAAGVRIVPGGARTARPEEDGWTVDTASGRIRGDWLIDATGRAGVVARQGFRARHVGPRTLALVGRWRGAKDRVDETSHTLVESYRDGWAWSVPLSNSLRCVTAMVDPGATVLDRSADLTATYRAELRKTTHIAGRLAGATPEGRVWACPASTYTAHTFGRPGLLLVGDAGSFIDPLSSFGVKKALASAWLAALVIHSARTDAAMARPAVDLFDAREREMYDRYAVLTARYCGAAAAHYGSRFWEVRAANAAAHDDHAAAERAALADLRACATLDLVPGSTVRPVRGPVVRGDRIVLDTRVATDALPEGVAHVRGVDVRRMVAVAPGCGDVPALHAACAPDAPLPDFLHALAYAVARGLLRPAR